VFKAVCFNIIFNHFFSTLRNCNPVSTKNRVVLYKGHDTRRTLIGTSHQPPLRIQRTLLPGQRSRLKHMTSLCVNCTTKHCNDM